jgi:acetyltransferase-like isoleucine patch superfamily enzyme
MRHGRDIYILFKPGLLGLSKLISLLPRSARYAVLAIFRGTPGLIGVGLRYACVRSLAASCGDNVYVGPYSFLSYLENCSLGSNVSIRELCVVGCLGGLCIGNNVSIAHSSSILTTEHDITYEDIPVREAPVVLKPTIIEDDVWLGAGVRITAGVVIGHGAVVGSGSVVTKSIPPYAVAVGVPARVIRFRKGKVSE